LFEKARTQEGALFRAIALDDSGDCAYLRPRSDQLESASHLRHSSQVIHRPDRGL